MTSNWWRALEHLGARLAAACDWRHYLGEDFDSCLPFLRQVSGQAETVMDPQRPSRRLDVVPDGVDGFVGILADDSPDGPPLPLSADDVVPLTPEWQAIAEELGKALGFTANRFETQGLTRQIGTARNGSDPERPVVLCLPGGHFGDPWRIAGDLAARLDSTVILPSAKWITPPIHALATANRLTLVAAAEQLLETSAVPALGNFPPVAGATKRKKPLFRVQSGWRWDMLTIEVASGGLIVASCGGQRKDYRFRKSNGQNHANDYEILMQLASKPIWRNPPTGTQANEPVRKQFFRLRATLEDLMGIPGAPFEMKGDCWKPNFKVVFHQDLTGIKEEIASAKVGEDAIPDWHPLSQDSCTLE